MAREQRLEGRDAELCALEAALDDACAGHGRVVVVSGEAGIGKSTLLSVLGERARARGVSPIWGRAWEFADAPAYFPLRPCLATLGVNVEQSSSAFGLWERVLAALSATSAQQPQLWLLEDLHAADLQSLDLLVFLAQPLRVLKVLLVVSARPHDSRLAERGQQRLLRLAREGLDLRLPPLDASGVERLARSVAGDLPGRALEQLLELTSGNPLFVVECARALKAFGLRGLRGVSPTILQLVQERLQHLPKPTRELLENAAVLGREFSAALLARVQDVLPARVVDALLPALKSGLVLERAPGAYYFSHALVHGAVYETLGAERRVRLHRAAGLALEQLPQALEVLLERARHALAALTPETEAETRALVFEAGRQLEHSGAFDRADALFGRLREKAALGELSQALSGSELLHLAHVAELAGKSAESRALSLSVIEQARRSRDWQLLALAALELGRALRPGLIDHELVRALREASAHFDETSPLGCRLLVRLAAALQPDPRPQLPVAMARTAIERARAMGDDGLLLEVLDVGGSAYVEYAPPELRLAAAEELLERALAGGDFTRTMRGRARVAMERATHGDFEAFEYQVGEMLAEAEAAGQARARIRPLLMSSLSCCWYGRYRESESALVEARQLLSLTDDPGLALSYSAHLASRALQMHRDPELLAIEQGLPKLVQGVPDGELVLHALRGAIRARLEQLEPALADLRAAFRVLTPASGAFLAILAEQAAFVAEPALAMRCYELLLPFAGSEAMGGHVSVSYEGPFDRLLGLLDAALGRTEAAERQLRATLALAERRGFSSWVAQGRYDLGKFLLTSGRADEARKLFEGAATLAEQCDMVGLVARARARATGAPATLPPAVEGSARLVMVREGELFRLERGSLTVRIRATRGAELLARLVDAPDQEIHVLALAAEDQQGGQESSTGEALDRTALSQYRARLRELTARIDQAESFSDNGRLEVLVREKAMLERELARALGLGGKARQTGSSTERARVNVQRRLKDAIERVAEASPELGRWLSRAVRTGTYCSFSVNG
jgi:tetratricopeptide (TPR) repeat protein